MWSLYKVQKNPSSHPHLLLEKFKPWAPNLPWSAAPDCESYSLRGRSVCGWEQGLPRSQPVTQHRKACSWPHLPAESNQISFYPSLQIPQTRSTWLFAACLSLQFFFFFFQEARGPTLQVPGPLSTHHILDPIFSSSS